MNKTDLTDVSFLIPVRIDSKARLENLHEVLTFLKRHFDTTIIVLEADKGEQVKSNLTDKKIFIKDSDAIFHRTKYINRMIREAATRYLAVWDTDVILPFKQVADSVLQLRQGKADMVFPYDGHFYDVSSILRKVYLEFKDVNILEKNKEKMKLKYGSHSVGGAFLVNKQVYEEAGLENEHFYGWGPEDAERVKRMEILGGKIARVAGNLYHLSHPRKSSSCYYNQATEIKLRQEFLRVCKMSSEELVNYTAIWK